MKRDRDKHRPPSADGGNGGRRPDGTFTIGNRFGKGGGAPLAARALQLRAALLDALTPQDVAKIARVMIRRAKRGDIRAAREVLNRALGKPTGQSTKEPLEVLTDGERIIAARADALQSLQLAHSRGEHLDDELDEDPFLRPRERLTVPPASVRRRILRELETDNG